VLFLKSFCLESERNGRGFNVTDEVNSEIEKVPPTNAILLGGSYKKKISKPTLRLYYSATSGLMAYYFTRN
jgi:hypothetical protein